MVPSKGPWTESRRSRLARLTRSFSRTLADHDGAQPQAVAAAGLLDQDAGQQPADAAEAVEDDVGAGAVVAAALADDLGQFLAEELFQGGAIALCLVLLGQPGDVDRCGAELQLGQGVQQRGGLFEQAVRPCSIRRAKRWALRMFMVDLLIRLRPWMEVTTLFSRYSRPITGIMASARASRPIHVSRQESDVWLTELPS